MILCLKFHFAKTSRAWFLRSTRFCQIFESLYPEFWPKFSQFYLNFKNLKRKITKFLRLNPLFYRFLTAIQMRVCNFLLFSQRATHLPQTTHFTIFFGEFSRLLGLFYRISIKIYRPNAAVLFKFSSLKSKTKMIFFRKRFNWTSKF